MTRSSPLAALRRDRTVQAVLAVTVLALVARLVWLGARVAHQDEARVGYWTLRFALSGRWEYRPIVHGPFVPILNRHVFGLVGASDLTARLVIAVVGGAAPAVALLYRGRLRDSETVALSLLLAANPVLLYYSRFMRQDVPLAVFMLAALGFTLRAVDAPESAFRRRRRYVLLASLAFGFAFTTKENAVLYPVAWLGALALVVDDRLLAVAGAGEGTALGRVRSWVDAVGRRRTGAAVAFLAANPVVVFLAGVPAPDSGPLSVGVVVAAALVGLAGYLVAVESANPLHYLAAIPIAILAFVAFVVALVPEPAGIFLLDPVLYLYDRFLVYYSVSWLLGAVLVADASLVSRSRSSVQRGLPGVAPLVGDGERRWFLPPGLGAYVLFFLVVVVFYAPRGGGYPATPGATNGLGLWSALVGPNPAGVMAVVWEAVVGTWSQFVGSWLGGHQDHPYIPFFVDFVKTLRVGALSLSVAAVLGVLADRYGDDGPRDLVSFGTYWGGASVLGYPLVSDIAAPWATVHAIVSLAFPAAVGLALVYRTGKRALAADDRAGVAIAVVLALAVVGQVGFAAVDGVYLRSQSPDNELVQYAQSSSTDLKPVVADVRAIARDNEGVDLLYYGNDLNNENESDDDQPYAGAGWFERLPLPWYTESWNYEWRGGTAEVVTGSTTRWTDVNASDAPVVVALADQEGGNVTCRVDAIEPHLEGYRKYCGQRYLYDSGTVSTIVVYVDTDRIENPAGTYRKSQSDPGSRRIRYPQTDLRNCVRRSGDSVRVRPHQTVSSGRGQW